MTFFVVVDEYWREMKIEINKFFSFEEERDRRDIDKGHLE